MKHNHKITAAIALSAVLLSLTMFYFAWSLTSASSSGTVRTMHSWLNSVGTGEGTMAIDPTNSDIMVYHALGLRDSVPSYSLDGGSTWNESIPFTRATPTLLIDPWTTYDSQGKAYASTYEGNTTHPFDQAYPFLAKSTDHGATFSLLSTSYSPPWTMWTMPNGTLAPSCYFLGPGAIDFPKIAADRNPTSPYRDYVYIVGAVGVNSSATHFCYGQTGIIRSTDGGMTWDVHKVLAGLNGEIVVRPDNLVVAPNGTVYFATSDYKGGVLIVYSKDGGATWLTSTESLGFVAGNPWIAVDRSNAMNLYIVFEKILKDNSTHIYMILSTNGGTTWSTPTRLDDILGYDTVDHTLPTIDVSAGGRIFVAWRDYRNTASKIWSGSNTTDIYAYSSASSGRNIRISSATGRYCGAFSPCYRVAGNDFFGVASSDTSDHIAFSLDEDGNSWPEAYDARVGYSTASGLSIIPTYLYRIVTSLYLEILGLVGVSLAVAAIVIIRRRRTAPQNLSLGGGPRNPKHRDQSLFARMWMSITWRYQQFVPNMPGGLRLGLDRDFPRILC